MGARTVLRGLDIATSRTGIAVAPDEAAQIAERIGYPVVLEGVGDKLLHEAERAARLDLHRPDKVRAAAEALFHPGCDFPVDRMVQGAMAELIMGATRDPQFGRYLTIGAVGITAEMWSDTRFLLRPASREQIGTAADRLRRGCGGRGRPPYRRVCAGAVGAARRDGREPADRDGGRRRGG